MWSAELMRWDGFSLGVQAVRPGGDFDRHSEASHYASDRPRRIGYRQAWSGSRLVDAEKEVFNRMLPQDKVWDFLGALPGVRSPPKKLALPHTAGVASRMAGPSSEADLAELHEAAHQAGQVRRPRRTPYRGPGYA